MGRVTHFEIPVDDADRAAKFYQAVFGWEFTQWGDQKYWLAKTGDPGEYGIDGALIQRTDATHPLVNSATVENVDETAAKVKANGGTIVVEKMAIPTIGWLIFFKDTEGNIHGAMENDPAAK